MLKLDVLAVVVYTQRACLPQDGVLGTPVAVPAAQLVVRDAAHSRAQIRHNCRATAATIIQTFHSALELYIMVFTVSKREADSL